MVSAMAAVKPTSTEVAGFQTTEIGMIPDDWTACSLPDSIWFQEGPGLRNWQFRSSGLKVVNVTNLLESGYLDLSNTSRHISFEEFNRMYKHFLIQENDVLMASSGNSYGKTAIARKQDLPLLMNTSVIRFQAKEGCDSSFMYTFLKSKFFKSQIDLMITGGAQPNFGPYHLRKIKIPLPSTIEEQRAIAEALSDADTLIESLEHLIAKKRQIKQGTAQELLSGKRRLDGFADKWSERTFGEIFDFLPTATNPRSDLREDVGAYYIHYGDIHTRFHSHLDFSVQQPSRIDRSKCKNAALIRNGDWIMADASEDFDGVGKCIEVVGLDNEDQAVSGLHTFLLRERQPTFVQGFKGHLCNSKSLRDQYLRVMTGMKVFGVSKAALKHLTLPVPSENEQREITAILSDMEAEISQLEMRAEKVRNYKLGMNEELLTGRVRLK